MKIVFAYNESLMQSTHEYKKIYIYTYVTLIIVIEKKNQLKH